MNKQHGFTLLELMVTVAVAAIIVTIAVPSFSAMLDRHRLEAAAGELKLNLQLARSQAIKHNGKIQVTFHVASGGSNWRYGLSDLSDPNACNPAAASMDSSGCTIDGAVKVYSSEAWRNVKLSLAGNDTLSFEPRRGMADRAHEFDLQSPVGTLRVGVSRIGRVYICDPDDGDMGSYRACR